MGGDPSEVPDLEVHVVTSIVTPLIPRWKNHVEFKEYTLRTLLVSLANPACKYTRISRQT